MPCQDVLSLDGITVVLAGAVPTTLENGSQDLHLQRSEGEHRLIPTKSIPCPVHFIVEVGPGSHIEVGSITFAANAMTKVLQSIIEEDGVRGNLEPQLLTAAREVPDVLLTLRAHGNSARRWHDIQRG